MSDWTRLNEQIAALRRSDDSVGKLEALFVSTNDGQVAMALGEVLRSRGKTDQAIRWFRLAEERYPLPAYKQRARAARTALEAPTQVTSPSDVGSGGSVLHVISCSKTKVWSTDGANERFVPAARAYRGADVIEWLRDPESRTARWLVLSAKYGFIEPDHPIGDYDVTFNDPQTGPISDDALRAQVRGQVRWSDRVPLNSFREVVVHGGGDYIRACRAAFDGIARVRSSASIDSVAARPSVGSPVPNAARAAALGAAFERVPDNVYGSLDRLEPEWPILARLAGQSSTGLITAVALALTDYQLGAGGAQTYWQEIGRLLDALGMPRTSDDVMVLVRELVKRPVSSRLAAQKLERIERLLASGLPDAIRQTTIDAIGRHTDRLWNRLAAAMGQRTDAKTIVFAMKVFDLLHCCTTGRYSEAGNHAPIIADLRIARVSISSGLLSFDGLSAVDQMSRAEQMLQSDREPFLRAWEMVRDAGRLNLFRVDSLVWQVAEPIFQFRHSPRDARVRIETLLAEARLETEVAHVVAAELTVALH